MGASAGVSAALPVGNGDTATGAGAQSRRIIGTTVFSGMLVATMVGILFIPSLYVLFQRMREWAHRRG
ncbi:efflux RND transporter permease subunit [Klebsiella pneumoniae]|nr:efflux RND transporter permease subunit [Klebsiella pneumoniae]